MKDIEEEVLRKLLVDLFLAPPRRRTHLQQKNGQKGMHEKTPTTTRRGSNNQPEENHNEKEVKT